MQSEERVQIIENYLNERYTRYTELVHVQQRSIVKNTCANKYLPIIFFQNANNTKKIS